LKTEWWTGFHICSKNGRISTNQWWWQLTIKRL
jgi:hypothetical protein